MSRLFLHCSLCGRRQADGLLSRAAWGEVQTPGGPLRACPTCRAKAPDWETRLAAAGANGAGVSRPAGTPSAGPRATA